jgi:dual specificity tyrosine-phosphorylation-regulated kinase 2/3/4
MSEAKDLGIKYPLTPALAVKNHSKYLTELEQQEISEFEEVFYLATDECKIHPTKAERIVNNGYDDQDGYYRISKNDQIGFRFQILEQIGKGAFGQVLKCYDHKTKQLVAMKLVKNQKKYYYQAAVEAKLLLLTKENDPENKECVIKIQDYFVFRNHLCMTFDLYSLNLYEFIKMYDYAGF